MSMIFAEAVAQVLARGLTPTGWESMLVPGAAERNEGLRGRYQGDRVGNVPLADLGGSEREERGERPSQIDALG